MLNFMNSVGKAVSLSQPWYLSGVNILGNSVAALALDFRKNRYAVDQEPVQLSNILTFSRSSIQTFADGAGRLQTADIDEPAIDVRGLAIFQDRKNFQTYSEDLSQWTGTTGNTRTLTDEVAPDGSTDSVYRFNRTTTSASFRRRTGITKDNATAETLAYSTYIKKDDANYFAMRIANNGYSNRADLVVDLSDYSVHLQQSFGVLSDFKTFIEDAGNGWYRVGIIATGAASTAIELIVSFNNDGGRVDSSDSSDSVGGYVWGAQMELGNAPSPYIPTIASQETRAFPSAEIAATEFADLFVNGEFSIVYDFTVNSIKDTSQLLWQMDASDGRVFLELGASGNISFGVQSDGATNFIGLGAIEAGKDYRLIVGAEDGNIVAQLSNGGIEYRTYNLPTLTSWDFAKTNFKPDVYTGYLAWYSTRLPDGTLANAADFVTEGDSYMNGANGIGIKNNLIADDYNVWNTSDGGSTLETAVARLEALAPKQTVIFCDGSVNGNSGVVATEIAKYQRAFDAAGGNIVFISPVLYPSLAGAADGQFTLDLTAAMLLEGWKVVDGTAFARTLSGVTFADAQDADDASYANASYSALFQADNVHPLHPLSDALVNGALNLL